MWPFAEEMIRDVGGKAETIFVPEMNSGQVAGEIMKYARCEVVKYNQTNGEIIHPHTIAEALNWQCPGIWKSICDRKSNRLLSALGAGTASL
jgi:pyruvate/2-oxoacid:ferredoxin oxidoreductase alpha subunit